MRCTFCGLDNTKNDDMYKHLINQNDCGDGPMTHVHTEHTNQKTFTTKQTKKDSKIGLASIIGMIAVVITIISSLVEFVQEINIDDYDYSYLEEVEYDPYESVGYELPSAGMTYSVTLEPGIYHVGTHIPEGTYTAEVVQGSYGVIEIQDNENNIYLYENIGYDDEQTTVGDLRLYQNGFFMVSTGVVIELTSENVQTTELTTAKSNLTDSYLLSEMAVAGEDFPTGVYNIVFEAGNGEQEFGEVQYCVPIEGDWEYEYSIFFDGNVGAETYHNVLFLEGTEIMLEDLEEVTLVPCEEIPDIETKEYYMFY